MIIENTRLAVKLHIIFHKRNIVYNNLATINNVNYQLVRIMISLSVRNISLQLRQRVLLFTHYKHIAFVP